MAEPFRPGLWCWLSLLALVSTLSVLEGGIGVNPLSLLPFALPESSDASSPLEFLSWLQVRRWMSANMPLLLAGTFAAGTILLLIVAAMAWAGALAHCLFIDALVWGARSLRIQLRRYIGASFGLGLLGFAAYATPYVIGGLVLFLLLSATVTEDDLLHRTHDGTILFFAALVGIPAATVASIAIFLLTNFVLPCAAVQRRGVFHAVGFCFSLAFGRPLQCILYIAIRCMIGIGIVILRVFAAMVLSLVIKTLSPAGGIELGKTPWPEIAIVVLITLVVGLCGLVLMQVILLPVIVFLRAMNLSFLGYVSPLFAGINPVEREREETVTPPTPTVSATPEPRDGVADVVFAPLPPQRPDLVLGVSEQMGNRQLPQRETDSPPPQVPPGPPPVNPLPPW